MSYIVNAKKKYQNYFERNRHTDRDKYRQTHKHTERQKYRKTHRHTDRKNLPTDRQTNRQKDRPTEYFKFGRSPATIVCKNMNFILLLVLI